jgi:predicted site-specific integrase-resolvase
MTALLIGYARCSTDQQDLTAQRDGLTALGVADNRVYVDHGLTGTNREHPGLREALAACREGDTLVVTKLDRLARSLPDARAIADELTVRQVRLNLAASVYDPTDPVDRLLFNVLAMVAEFESDLIRLRTKEGMKVAKAKGRLRGKQPKLNQRQEAHLWRCSRAPNTAPLNSPTCSGLLAPPSTGRWNGSEFARSRVSAAQLVDSACCPAWQTSRDSNALFLLESLMAPQDVRLAGRNGPERQAHGGPRLTVVRDC